MIGLNVGRDPAVTVADYPAPFTFTGTLDRVVFDLEADQDLDLAAVEEAELARQ